LESPGVFAPHAEQYQLGHIAEVKADATTVGSAIFSDFVPNQIALVLKTPSLHNCNSIRKQSIRNPKVQVGSISGDIGYREPLDIVQRHCSVSGQAFMFRGDFPSPVLKLPGRIRQDGAELTVAYKAQEILADNR
jgi:hypothetical protein